MAEFVMYEGRQVSTRSDLGRELMKHEKPDNWTPEGNPYPKAMYKAARDEKGKIRVVADEPFSGVMAADEYNRALERAKMFNRNCYLEVKSYEEHMKAKAQGWRDHPTEAVEYFEAGEREIGNVTANRAFHDSKMSEKAQAEAAAADAATEFHVPAIPESRSVKLADRVDPATYEVPPAAVKRPPGRPKRVQPVA